MGLSIAELLVIAVGLSMDAFAVSVCKGLSVRRATPRHALCVGLYFGGFQALMPLIGYFLAGLFAEYVQSVSGVIAFVLLSFIGGGMIREALSSEEEKQNDSFSPRTMLPLAVATSIDALATGVTFAVLEEVNIWAAVSMIGVITCALSAAGLKIGNAFGSRYEKKAELFGGCVLVLMGVKILLQQLGVC